MKTFWRWSWFAAPNVAAMLAVWDFKHGFFYWGAYCIVVAIDSLLMQYQDTSKW
jgi:hypothetical protein